MLVASTFGRSQQEATTEYTVRDLQGAVIMAGGISQEHLTCLLAVLGWF